MPTLGVDWPDEFAIVQQPSVVPVNRAVSSLVGTALEQEL